MAKKLALILSALVALASISTAAVFADERESNAILGFISSKIQMDGVKIQAYAEKRERIQAEMSRLGKECPACEQGADGQKLTHAQYLRMMRSYQDSLIEAERQSERVQRDMAGLTKIAEKHEGLSLTRLHDRIKAIETERTQLQQDKLALDKERGDSARACPECAKEDRHEAALGKKTETTELSKESAQLGKDIKKLDDELEAHMSLVSDIESGQCPRCTNWQIDADKAMQPVLQKVDGAGNTQSTASPYKPASNENAKLKSKTATDAAVGRAGP